MDKIYSHISSIFPERIRAKNKLDAPTEHTVNKYMKTGEKQELQSNQTTKFVLRIYMMTQVAFTTTIR